MFLSICLRSRVHGISHHLCVVCCPFVCVLHKRTQMMNLMLRTCNRIWFRHFGYFCLIRCHTLCGNFAHVSSYYIFSFSRFCKTQLNRFFSNFCSFFFVVVVVFWMLFIIGLGVGLRVIYALVDLKWECMGGGSA